MPSGVSQGSALPARGAAASGANATSAKLGMRLIPWFPQTGERSHSSTAKTYDKPPGTSLIMIRMLVADDGCHLFRPVVLQRGLARHVRDPNHPAEPRFRAILSRRDHPVRPVEGAGHDLDPLPVDAAEAQRRAAIPAEIAFGDGRGFERRR